jgi:SPP1 gp7 family putative phage head morphogenesis protein
VVSVNQQLQDRVTRHAIALNQYERGLSDQIIAFLNDDLEPRLVARMKVRLDRIARLRRDTGVKSTKALQDMMDGVRGIVREWTQGARRLVVPELKRLAVAEAGWQAAALQSVLPASLEVTLPAPALLRQIVTEKTINGAFLGDWFKKTERNILERVTRETNLGLAGGETPDQIIRRIAGTKRRGFSDGVLNISRREANTLVRTAASHTAQQASSAVAQENADILKGEEWVSTLDARTCPVCGDRDGKVYDLGEGPMPPAHPLCRCFRVAVTKSWRELGFDVDELDAGTRASFDGQVPASTSFPEWLKGRNQDDVAQVLGSQKAAQKFLAGEMQVKDFSTTWGKPLSLKAAMAGK